MNSTEEANSTTLSRGESDKNTEKWGVCQQED